MSAAMPSSMKWRYCSEQGRLFASGSQMTPDFIRIRSLISRGQVPRDLNAIVYRDGPIVMIVRGRVLAEWVNGYLFYPPR
jgi:hypothetical protein